MGTATGALGVDVELGTAVAVPVEELEDDAADAVTFVPYTVNRFPAPQYWVEFPLHVMLHEDSVVLVAPFAIVVPQ